MSKPVTIAFALLAAMAAAAGTGYWFGSRGEAGRVEQTLIAPAAPTGAAKKARKLLYYRNPMGLPDTSPVPKKDPMGMDYVPVYEGDATQTADAPGNAGGIRISTEKVQKLGVRTEAVALHALDRVVRAAGRVQPDERRMYAIAPRFEGYVERLHVNVTGQPVARGQPLFEVYSPELVSAQHEYAIAEQGVAAVKGSGGATENGMRQLAASSLLRLRNWDIPDAEIEALARSGQTKRTLTFRSPVSGVVTEKKALQGMRFMPGDTLYQVADLSAVWVIADVFEQDIGLVKTGAPATVRIDAYPGRTFSGRITYVYPTLNPETRTIPVRVELPNPGQRLKPGMYADVELSVGGRAPVLAVPASAVIDSGVRQIVLVDAGEGRFEPREVKLGARGDRYVEVLSGLKNGEQVVVAANFLIDAESNLKAALGAFGPTATDAGKRADRGAGTNPVHAAAGTVDSVDAKAGTVSLSHGPVADLKWPAMTMEFKVANASLLAALKPGSRVAFEFVERNAGEWVITSARPQGGASAVPRDPHAGH